MKRIIGISVFATAGFIFFPTYATNLVDVYQQALSNDPTFAQAQAQWMHDKQAVKVANGGILPVVGVTGNVAKNRATPVAAGNQAEYDSYGATLTVTQPIFNLANWDAVESADYSVKQAMATFSAAAQSLMQRSAKAYFQVLQDSDTLNYDEAQRQSLESQLVTAQQKYKVGLIAITDVYQAQAQYDSQVATEIGDRATLQDDMENLRAITGNSYDSITGTSLVPLATPAPQNIDAWVSTAEDQNYALKAQEYAVLSSKSAVSEADAANYPTVAATAQAGHAKNNQVGGVYSTTGYNTASIGLTANFNVFNGGAMMAAIRQAKALYLVASAQLVQTHRAVINQTRQAYLSVMSSISQIKADEQTIRSAEKALETTKAGYAVGTKTMTDVLQSVSTLYQAKKSYSTDEYTYLNNIILLKQNAGTLGPDDLTMINSWLNKSISLTKQIGSVASATSSSIDKSVAVDEEKNGSAAAKTAPPTATHTATSVTAKSVVVPAAKLAPVKPATNPAHSYSIQVYATHSEKSANDFAAKHPSANLRVIQSKTASGTWYKVLSGNYPTHDAAKAAIATLPADLKNSKPWVVQG